MKSQTKKGIALVEVLFGVAIAGLVIVFVSHTLTLFVIGAGETRIKTKALYLAEEGMESVRYLRDSSWSLFDTELSNGTTYYLAMATSSFATTTVPEVIDGTYTRSFEITEVRRDADDDIVDSGGTVDPDSRYITFTVGWGTASVTLSSLMSNLFDS